MGLSQRQVRLLIVVGLVIGLVAAPAVAAFLDNSAPVDDVTLHAPDGPAVTFEEAGQADLQTPFPDANTVDLQSSNGNISVSSTGRTNVTVSRINGSWTNASAIDTNSRTLTLNPDDKSAVSVSGGVSAINVREDAAVGVDDGQTDFVYSADAAGEVTLNSLPANTEFIAATKSGDDLGYYQSDSSGSATISVDSATDAQVVLQTNHPPSVNDSSASPADGTVIQSEPTLSIDVSDPEFGTDVGETLTVEWFVDGDKRGETTVNQNGTASYTLENITAGSHTWHAVVTDSRGESTTSQTFDFGAPSELRIYSENNPSELIDGENVSLRVRFFADGSEQVIERTVSDGTVDFEGLPADQRYIVTVRSNETEKWTYRRIVVDSLIETSDIYLLNESEPSSQIVFELDDPTGQFPPEETTLYVEKPITKDYDGDNETETRYEVIAGDIFGASGDFPVVLQEEERYRLRVETSDGDSSRILGFYSVSGPATERLQIQRVAPDPDADEGASFRATIEERSGQDYIVIRYQDFAEETVEVQYEVVDANGTVVVANTTRTADSFADLYPVPDEYGDDPAFTVNYHIERQNDARGGQVKLGQLSAFAQRFGLDPQILTILSYIAILGTMGLVVINNTRVAPFAGTAVASGLTIIGTIAIPMVVLSVAGIVSILVLVGGGQ